MTPTPAFSPDVVDAVLGHMNKDHARDNLLIVRAFTEHAEASGAVMTGLDDVNGYWGATVGERTVEATIPWSMRLTERAQIRAEAVRLHTEARARLGLPAE